MLIEIWSDLVCPWCYIGKRNLEAALERAEHSDQFEIRWRSWELDPKAPTHHTLDYRELLAKKYSMTLEQSDATLARMTAAAAEVGLDYRFDLVKRANTFDAHRLVHLGAESGIADAVKERLFAGYFTEGRSITDHESLRELAIEAGLDAQAVDAVLASDRFAAEVRADEERGRDHAEVTAVPFFFIDGIGGVAGAQPPELLAKMFDRGFQKLG